MIKSRKFQLATVLFLAYICAPLLSAEPNEAKTELKFETKSSQEARMLLRSQYAPPYGATHYAVLFVRGDWYRYRIPIDAVLETTPGRAMSQKQRDITSNQSINTRDYNRTISNYTLFQLYGISEDDTKKLAEAVIDTLTSEADKKKQSVLKVLKEHKEKTSEIKKKLPEKQKIYDEAKSKYEQIKNARYFSQINDGEVYTRAKDTMFQMDKTLDTLEIELAGIQEKLNSIEKYRRNKYAEDAKRFSLETLDKLDQMYVEQMIELKSAKVRQQAALEIREREKKFLDLFSQWSDLENEVNTLKRQLADLEDNLRHTEAKLATPTPEMLPPKVFQNKVTIYPVKPLNR